ncbi:glycoside hydrolase family 28 protein [Massilia sp. TS11]|uniref:glycoside hydrolase family 28 protein n=1 Tax=Massilia sp. TS11 TaxID=2908003 RepID=UPI001EDAD74C|nr:glycoside hydrolase family 28 protein [Massilia sp. TS11]MCG2583764.1 glycoside hydrolase family 28 protein [Massilia sp. TS11]
MQVTNLSRRELLKLAAAGSAAAALPAQAGVSGDPWLVADAIVKRLRRTPRFPARDFLVTAYGAAPCATRQIKAWVSHDEQDMLATPDEGAHDCYAAFKAAIEACAAAGGGRVIIPKGNWFCAGPIVLRSHVHLHLQAGAHVYFSQKPEDYARHGDYDCGARGKLTLSRWQSNDCLNYSPMIYAFNEDNIALTGEDWSAVLDGQGGVPFNAAGDCWWTWKGKNRTINPVSQANTPNYRPGQLSQIAPNPLNAPLEKVAPWLSEDERRQIAGEGSKWSHDEQYLPALSEAGVPLHQRAFGLGHYLRPPMIHLIGCTNVLLEGYHVINTPFWQHHPVHCRNLVIRKVHAESLGPNSDGFDPEACDHVLVEDCMFDTGDDCIAIKAGKNRDTQYGPSQNIVIQGCTMQSGHGAVTLGSEMAGGIENVFARDLVFENKNWASNPLNTAIRLKTNMNRGGYLRHFYVKNVRIPNGVQLSPSFYASLPGSPIASRTVATAAGAVVTFDCDYTPTADTVRTRPPEVSDVHISQVTVGDVSQGGKRGSCYQAVVILGPVASDYNGAQPMPAVLPVRRVTIKDCDFGHPVNDKQPLYLYNVQGLKLDNVRISGQRMDASLSA